jgi:4-carboxymuconolactone decarboxylase
VSEELLQLGLGIRREVLGAEYVDQATAGADDFTRDFQNIVSEYCWGAAWGREALTRRDRSLLNLAMLGALNRGHEFKLHLRGALRNGCTREEIQDTLIQLAIYAGIPAGVEAFRLAREVFAAVEAEEAEAAGNG